MEKDKNIFPILSMKIDDCGFSPLIKNGCKKLKVDTVAELLLELQNNKSEKVFGLISRQKLTKELKKHCNLILDKNLKISQYQEVTINEKISPN